MDLLIPSSKRSKTYASESTDFIIDMAQKPTANKNTNTASVIPANSKYDILNSFNSMLSYHRANLMLLMLNSLVYDFNQF